jgi:hypothetical protein
MLLHLRHLLDCFDVDALLSALTPAYQHCANSEHPRPQTLNPKP